MGTGPDRGSGAGADVTYSFAPVEPGRVLEVLTQSVGPMPRVLLPDTRGGRDESPVVKPSSPEMPPRADRSSRVQLLGEIARGGMGAILKGRDPDLGRDLAVKVLLETHRDNPDLIRRFVEEAQIGGQLQHPGIVPVYELGTFGDSRPYFTMKLVKGRTLGDLMAARQGPGEDLPRFLGIFEQVARAVAYAHARGVIHRDLKPSNVMVGSFGEVQVMDWGLAKVLPKGGSTDDAPAGRVVAHETVIATARSVGLDADLSHAGSIMGTPSYMAPEQARGEVDRVDERADVFALGSILGEVLTGLPAFLGRNSGEIQRKAALGDTAEALGRLEACGADPDLVALARRCLSREPEDRPRDAGMLSGQVTAYLSGVQEKLKVSERERAVAEATAVVERKRRKLQVGLAASILALTVVGGLALTYQLRQRQARAALIAKVLGEATTLRDLALARPDDLARWQTALASARQAEGAVDQSDPEAARQLARLLEGLRAGAEAAERDRTLLDRLVDIRSARADDPDGKTSESAYAGAFREAGFDMGEPTSSIRSGEKIKARPPAVALAIATSLDNWAAVRRDALKNAAGARRLAESADQADPDPWRVHLRSALNEPDRAKRKAALQDLARTAKFDDLDAISLDLLGRALKGVKDAATAELVLRQAQRRHPGDVWVNFDLADILDDLDKKADSLRYYVAARSIRPETAHDLAHALEKNGEAEEAVAVFQGLIKLRPENGAHPGCLGGVLKRLGRADEANASFDRAIAANRASIRLRPDDSDVNYRLGNILKERGELDGSLEAFRDWARRNPRNATARDYLGDALKGRGKLEEAIAEYRQAIEIAPQWSVARHDLGVALVESKKYGEAIEPLREAIRLDPDNANARHHLGLSFHRRNQFDEAVVEYREAIRLTPRDAILRNNLGSSLFALRRHEEAMAEYREAVGINPKYADAQDNLGRALTELGRHEEALAVFRAAIALSPGEANVRGRAGVALYNLGRHDEAIAEYREAIRLDPQEPICRTNLGNALQEQGKYDEAIEAHREAIRLKPDDARFRVNLGSSLDKLKRVDEALAEYREAVRLQPDLAEARNNLGNHFRNQGKFDEALVELREAVRLRPDLPQARSNLGRTWLALGRIDDALAEYREAVRLRPNNADDRGSLGGTLRKLNRNDEAIAAFREAIRLNPDDYRIRHSLGEILEKSPNDIEAALKEFQEADRLMPNDSHLQDHLGGVLRMLFRFDEAAAIYRRAVVLPGLDPAEGKRFTALLVQVERLGSLFPRLASLVKGEAKPKDNAEALGFVQLCYDARYYAASARVWDEAFSAAPTLAEDREGSQCYNAACAAALAASGKGKDAPPDEPARARLRAKALDWLEVERVHWTRRFDSGTPEGKAEALANLQHWREDSDLIGIRDPEPLSKLPDGERETWRGFWDEVGELLGKMK